LADIPEVKWQVRKDSQGGNRPLCRFVEITACVKYSPTFDFTEWDTITGNHFNSGGILKLVDYRLKLKKNGKLTSDGHSTLA
jgi:hypothetical protein